MINKSRQAKKGQAVVEYAGALVLATVVVAAAVLFMQGNNGISAVLTSVMTKVTGYFNGVTI